MNLVAERLHRPRTLLVVAVLLIVTSSLPANAQQVLANGCRQYILEPAVPADEMQRQFYVTAGAERFYVWSNPETYPGQALCVSVRVAGIPIVLGRYVKLGGKTVEIGFGSSDMSVIAPVENGLFAVIGTGRALLTVTIADARVEIPVEIAPLPVPNYAKAGEIISALGLPDHVTKEYVPWPESRFVDNIFYGKREDAKGWRVHHWLYDAFPGLVIALDEDDVWPRALYNQSWEIVRQQWLEQNW